MTVADVDDPRPTLSIQAPPTVPTRVLRRVWSAPLVSHAAVLAVVLVALGLFAGARSSFTVDEANIILQAQAIEHGHWTLPDPFPAVDRGSLAAPVLNGTLSPQGVVPIARHLLYTVLVAALLRLGGPAAVTGLAVAGTVLAALAAAWLARLYAPGNERAALWVTGLASPLFLYGVVDTGQSFAAGAGAVSAALLIAYWRGGRPWTVAGAAAAMAMAVLAREEAVLWCAATALAAVVVAARPRGAPPTRRLLVGVAVTVVTAGMLRGAELVLSHHLFRTVTAVAGNATTLVGVNSGSWANRAGGAATALFGAGPVGDVFSLGSLPIFLAGFGALVLGCVAAVAVRRREPGAAAVASTLAALFVVIRLLHAPTQTVSGLLLAFPLAGMAMGCVSRRDWNDVVSRFVVVTAAVFAVGVAATIHPDGGGLQWGGRYFVMALPVLAPLGVQAIRRRVGDLPRMARTVFVVSVGVMWASATVQMAASVVGNHRSSAELASVVRSAATLAPPGDGGQPVALSASYPLGSLWPIYTYLRLLYPTPAQLSDTARRMRDAGVARAVLVTTDPTFENIDVGGSYRVERTLSVPPAIHGWVVEILARR